MPSFERGVYVITNCVYPNHAALLNANANEDIRGVFPESETTVRDSEKVRSRSALTWF